jgi:hypothetical protein
MNALFVVAPGPSRRQRLAIGFIGAAVTALTLFVTSAPTAHAAPPGSAPVFLGVSGLTSAAAGTAQTVKVTALVNGKVNAGYRGTVVLTSTDAQAVLPAQYTFTAADKGVHSFPVTLKTSGSQQVTATDTASSAYTGSQTVTVSPGPAKTFALSGLAAVTAGTQQSTTLTVRDAFNNVATGYRGTVHFTSSDPQAVLPANYAFTAADAGSHAFSVTLKTVGSRTVSVTDIAAPTLAATSAPAAVSPANAASLTLGGLGNAVAGASQSVLVTAHDPYGNVATGYTGTVGFSSSDPQATLPSNDAFTAADAGSRSFSVTLKSSGQRSVTVTDQANSSLSSSQTVTISAGPAVSLDMTTNLTGAFQGSPIATAGQSFNVILTALDAYGNRAPGYTGTVELTSTDALTQAGTVQFMSGDAGRVTRSGIAFFTKKIYSEHASLTAVDTGNSQFTDVQNFQVLPGPAVTYSCPQPLSKASDYQLANGPIGVNDDVALPFTALDAYGNNATNREPLIVLGPSLPYGYEAVFDGAAVVTTSDAQAVNITRASFSGHALLVTRAPTITLRTAGVQTVTITDLNDPNLTKTCSYSVFAPEAVTGTIHVADPRTTGNTTLWLAATTGVAGNDPVTIDLFSVPMVNDPTNGLSPLGTVVPSGGGNSQFLAWDLNPANPPPGTITCDLAAPCAATGLLQIAYTIRDNFGNPPSSGILSIEPWNRIIPPGNVKFITEPNNTVFLQIDGKIENAVSITTLPLGTSLNGVMVNANTATGSGTVTLQNGASLNVALPTTNTGLQVGEPVVVRLQQPVTVDSQVGQFCVTHESVDASGNVVRKAVCSNEFGCTAASGGPAPVELCQTSSFAAVTIVPGNSDPNKPPPATAPVLTTVATEACGTISDSDNAACPRVYLNFAAKKDGGSGWPPVGFVNHPYAFDPGCDEEPCTFFKFKADSYRQGGEEIKFTWSSISGDPVPGLTLSEDGLVEGSPTRAGFFTFRVIATGATTGATDDALVTVLIQPDPTP